MNDLALIVDGRRLAADSPQARDIPRDLRFSTTWQGGFEQLDSSLTRGLADYAEEQPDSRVELLADGGAATWFEGRLEALPRTIDGARQEMAAQVMGLATLLEDRADAMWLGIDRDLGRWQPPSPARQTAIMGIPLSPRDAQVRDGVLQLDVSGAWSTNNGRPWTALDYDATPLKVGRVMWGSAVAKNMNAGHWSGTISAFSTPAGGPDVVGDWFGVGDGDQGPQDVAINDRIVEIGIYTGLGSASEFSRKVDIADLCVVGDHGIPLTGTSPANYGIKFDDAIRDWLRRFVPGLKAGNIADAGIGIQQLAFLKPTTPGEMLRFGNNFHAWTWGVWEGGRLDAGPFGYGSSRTWYVRAGDPGVRLGLDGARTSSLWTGLVVHFTDAKTGRPRSVGAPGTVCEQEDAALAITDRTHPLIRSGRPRIATWELDIPCDPELAAQVGQIILAHLNQSRRSGDITVWGPVRDEDGIYADAMSIRGGDQVVVTNTGDPVPRRIVRTDATVFTGTNKLTLDNTRQTVEAMLQHVGARLTGVT